MEIDTDNYSPLPVERIPKDEPARSDYLSRQNAALRSSLSIMFSRYPEAEKHFTRFQLENAKPLYGIRDAAETMHWTFTNPANMGS